MKVFIARKSYGNLITTHLIVINSSTCDGRYDSFTLRVSKLKKRLSKKYIKNFINSLNRKSYISYEFSEDITVDEVYKNYTKACESFQKYKWHQTIGWIKVYEIKL